MQAERGQRGGGVVAEENGLTGTARGAVAGPRERQECMLSVFF